MSSHTHRLMSDHTTFELLKSSDRPLAGLGGAPIAPSQRLPLIAHTLREARVAIAELRYEGRGGLGGFITEFNDRHRLKSLGQSVDDRITQQLTGFLWQLVLRPKSRLERKRGIFRCRYVGFEVRSHPARSS